MNTTSFFKEFDGATRTKLNLLKNYVRTWLPTFIHSPKSIKEIHIYDPFCGPGETEDGEAGSPLIILTEVFNYIDKSNRYSPPIKLFFSDKRRFAANKLASLPQIIEAQKRIDISIQCIDIQKAFEFSRKSRMNDKIATFMFLDQFGIVQLNKNRVLELSNSPKTDWMAFMSSTAARRFLEHENLRDIPKAQYGALKDCHRDLTSAYRKFIDNPEYFVLPFSIKKGANIYGLIFGTGHPRGAEKFLNICWKIDKHTGEANYSIDNPKASCEELPLLTPNKIRLYRQELKNLIQNGTLRTNKDVFLHAMQAGISPAHARSALQKLVQNNVLKNQLPVSYESIYKKGNVATLGMA